MDRLRPTFSILSILFLVILAVSPFKDFFREWKFYQYGYNRLIAGLPQKVAPAEIGIRQIWNQKLDRVDRCVTCHLGLKVDALKDAPQPYRTHPRVYHDIEEFGCTICHEGQGSATEFRESIGRVKYWDKPILPKGYLEAACAKCHKEQVVPQAPLLNLGRKLIAESNCVGCHKIEGYEKQWVPRLDGIGSKVNRQWLVGWLKNPRGYFPKTRMPNFLLSDDEANTLADFLASSVFSPEDAQLEPLPARLISATEEQKAKLAELGSTRFKEARCISCHSVNGKGGTAATELGKIASKANPRWLYNYLKNPKGLLPDVRMPRYRFSEEDLIAVVAYMESEFVDEDLEAPPPHTAAPGAREQGLALFKKYNCSGCHSLGDLSKPAEWAPDLTMVGSKKLYEIDFGKSGIEETLPLYLDEKLLEPRVFSGTMKMPRFGFTPEEARAITVALLGNTAEKIPDQYLVHSRGGNTFTPQGEFGKLVNDLACLGCHTMGGRGHLIATDLTMEGSQAKSEWIEGYFKVPYSLRPILTERMPKLFLPDVEIRTLVDYMQTVFIADSLERLVTRDGSAAVKGRGLYFERYACQACHQIEGKGGYAGPPLDKLSQRLKPGWVFHWLKNPQAFKPESIEPNNRLTDEEADELTAFLMTLN